VGAISLSTARTDLDVGGRFQELALATLVAMRPLKQAADAM
jgi:hypothetical protein